MNLLICFIIWYILQRNESFSVYGGGKSISQNLVGFVDNSGQLYEGGDYVLGQDGGKFFKDDILSRFAKVSQNTQ